MSRSPVRIWEVAPSKIKARIIVRAFIFRVNKLKWQVITMETEILQKPLHIGRATELAGKDRALYRFYETVPGLLSWGTIVGAIVLSWLAPVWAALFIITFDFYWLLKTIYLSTHLRQNWKRMRHNMKTDWAEKLENLKHEHLRHMIILPFYKESFEVVDKTVQALADSHYDLSKMSIVLAAEGRAIDEAQATINKVEEKYKDKFGHFIVTVHPADVPGEMAGKGSNIAYAAEEARVRILDANDISYGDVIVSAFDIDTVVFPHYFNCITWHFLNAENPYRVSFQPVPLYNNNIWDTPALSRVVATSGTFWQMVQQERPERLATFSSHSLSFKTLYEIGYWQKNMVSEDSRIFWNAYMATNGNYSVIPISYPVSMDANLDDSFWKTVVNIYKQQRRWGWGVENVPYILYSITKNKTMSLRKKFHVAYIQLEGFWSLATNPILIFLLGWLPLVLGGNEFRATVLSYNLPIITRNMMLLAMSGLVISAIISLTFLPERPKTKGQHRYLFMLLQWVLIPITMTILGAFPGIDAQTRLMFGKYMGFWVTPKHRENA